MIAINAFNIIENMVLNVYFGNKTPEIVCNVIRDTDNEYVTIATNSEYGDSVHNLPFDRLVYVVGFTVDKLPDNIQFING